MDFITFKQFIYTINIRNYYRSTLTQNEVEDNNIIRIYYGKEFDKNCYIDIGWYDYFRKDSIWKILESYLKKEILDSVVTDFSFNEDFMLMEVYTCSKEDLQEDLKEYQN